MADSGFSQHDHEDVVHGHEHLHITHHVAGGDPSRVEHLTSMHVHEHNHPQVGHAHAPHDNAEREHEHEGHIHDHAHPAQS